MLVSFAAIPFYLRSRDLLGREEGDESMTNDK
jgi:hypothetical protein